MFWSGSFQLQRGDQSKLHLHAIIDFHRTNHNLINRNTGNQPPDDREDQTDTDKHKAQNNQVEDEDNAHALLINEQVNQTQVFSIDESNDSTITNKHDLISIVAFDGVAVWKGMGTEQSMETPVCVSSSRIEIFKTALFHESQSEFVLKENPALTDSLSLSLIAKSGKLKIEVARVRLSKDARASYKDFTDLTFRFLNHSRNSLYTLTTKYTHAQVALHDLNQNWQKIIAQKKQAEQILLEKTAILVNTKKIKCNQLKQEITNLAHKNEILVQELEKFKHYPSSMVALEPAFNKKKRKMSPTRNFLKSQKHELELVTPDKILRQNSFMEEAIENEQREGEISDTFPGQASPPEVQEDLLDLL